MDFVSHAAVDATVDIRVDPREVDAEMIRTLYHRVKPLIIANFGALILLTVSLWGKADTRPLLVWACALGGWTMLRFVLARVYMRRPRPLGETWRWTLMFALGATVAGSLWGWSVTLIGSFETDNAKLVAAFLMAALSAAAIAGYTNSLLAFAGFVGPALVPYGIRLIYIDGSPHLSIAVFVVFWGFLLWTMARHLNESFRSSLELSFHNRNLAMRWRDERDRAEAASAAKSRFLGHMSHELRTPLNAIIGYSEMMAHRLLGPLGNDKYAEYANDIHTSGLHLLRQVAGILDLTDLETGTVRLVAAPVDLAAILADAAAEYAERAQAGALAFDCRLPADLPRIRGDGERVRQIAASLLSNAVKFTKPGGTVTLTAFHDPGEAIGFTVFDTGIGMSAGDIATATVPFARLQQQDYLRRSDDAPGGGQTSTRLGLPLARLLAEAHDGTLAIDSAPGAGTAVTVRLPIARVIVDAPDAAVSPAGRSTRRSVAAGS